jgi:DNA-directed RNA polymerase subunit RPC12/RpoP
MANSDGRIYIAHGVMSRALLPIVVILFALLISYVAHRRTASLLEYRCSNCGNVFHLSPIEATISPHRLGGRKYARCALCGARTWVTRLPKGVT